MQKKHSLASLAFLALSFMYTGQASAQGAWSDMGDTIVVDKDELIDVLRRIAISNKRNTYRPAKSTNRYGYNRGYQPGSTIPVYNTMSRQVERIPVYVPQGVGMGAYPPINYMQNPQSEEATQRELQQTQSMQEQIDQLQTQLQTLGRTVQDPAIKHQMDSMANRMNMLRKWDAAPKAKPLVEKGAEAETDSVEQPQVDELENSRVTMPFDTNVRQVFFEISSDKLTNEATHTLKEAAKLLVSNRNLKVKLAGYASKDGSKSFNQDLAMRRMKSVKSCLLHHGVEADQIKTLSYNIDQKSDLSTYARRVDLCISL